MVKECLVKKKTKKQAVWVCKTFRKGTETGGAGRLLLLKNGVNADRDDLKIKHCPSGGTQRPEWPV